ncbi:MAG: hypothetical protein QOG43_1672 [Actinomycetota bacterium]|jgi:hypothetical protein|nr:hypothetical protein [Actinomycetota bacterium]
MPVTSPSVEVAGAGGRPCTVPAQFSYLRRAVRWPPIVVAAAAAVPLALADAPPAIVIAVAAAGLSYVLDDPAAAILDATPASRPRRLVLRLGLTLPLAVVLWLAVVLPLWSLRPGAPPTGPADLALATLVAVVLAGSAVGGGVAGGPLALALAVAGTALPAPWTMSVAAESSRNWLIVLALATAGLVVVSRDPAIRTRRRRP